MNLKIFACAAGFGLGVGIPAWAAPLAGAAAVAQPAPVAALAAAFKSQGVNPDGLESRLTKLCNGPATLGDQTEALLIAGYDVFTVVRDMILACGKGGKGAEVASEVASRALLVKGLSVRHLIDAGVLAAAAEIERRRRMPAVAVGATPVDQAKRDLERERLERMMQKGLIDDEYREYIEERRREAEREVAPLPEAGYEYGQEAIYGSLFNLGLVGGGFYDDAIDPFVDPGAPASDQ